MPITEQMYFLLHEGKSARQVVVDLMTRELKRRSIRVAARRGCCLVSQCPPGRNLTSPHAYGGYPVCPERKPRG